MFKHKGKLLWKIYWFKINIKIARETCETGKIKKKICNKMKVTKVNFLLRPKYRFTWFGGGGGKCSFLSDWINQTMILQTNKGDKS